MADKKEEKKSYLSRLANFYFAPKPRSVLTIFFLIVYGFFVVYYIDNVFLAFRYVTYIVFGTTVLQDTSYLLWGVSFILSLILPFSISLYSIFLLYEVWQDTQWSRYAKGFVTFGFILFGLLVISMMDDAARYVARQDVMQSFMEDMNLTGRI
ncbi:MAG: hypothetical protein WC767_00590 [Candidatus Paceibacterota bacterium]|jgi:hypothetical protein